MLLVREAQVKFSGEKEGKNGNGSLSSLVCI